MFASSEVDLGSKRSAWLSVAAVATVVLLLDQGSKLWIRNSLLMGERHDGFAFLDIVRVGNKGVAFGVLGGHGWLVPALSIVASIAVLVWFAKHAREPWTWLPAGLVIGGAFGNFVDRGTQGEVTDFIKLPHWPAFNIADIAITCGVILLVILAEMNSRRDATTGN